MTPLFLPTFEKRGTALLVKPFEVTTETCKSEWIHCVFDNPKSAVIYANIELEIPASGTTSEPPLPLLHNRHFLKQKSTFLNPGWGAFFWDHYSRRYTPLFLWPILATKRPLKKVGVPPSFFWSFWEVSETGYEHVFFHQSEWEITSKFRT